VAGQVQDVLALAAETILRLHGARHPGAGPRGHVAELESLALFGGHEYPVYLRVAECDGEIYVDLCDDQWRQVRIAADGWTVEEPSPVRFRRALGMKALPIPEPGGDIEELREFLNVDDEGFIFYVAWLLVAYEPNSPNLVLVAYGEHGAAKSTAGRVVRELIDPNKADLRRATKSSRDLVIAANNSWVVTVDNVSHLTNGFSDDLCRLATGGGFSARTLYTDEDETIFEVRRAVIVNGVEEPATRGDLVDRSVLVEHLQIPEDRRIPEEEFNEDFERARPLILGALFDALSGAIDRSPTTRLERLPRMADAAKWVTAAEEALGWEPGTFMAAFHVNREDAQDIVIEGSLIGPAILRLDAFTGTATELLTALNLHADEKIQRLKDWPRNGRKIRGELDRLAPALRSKGWTVDFHREGSGSRIITLTPPPDRQVQATPSEPSDASVEPKTTDGLDGMASPPTVWDSTPSAEEPHEQALFDGSTVSTDSPVLGQPSPNGREPDRHPCPSCGKSRLTVSPMSLCSACEAGVVS
jgi:hypothetical protein